MPEKIKKIPQIDWVLFMSLIPIISAGLVTMSYFVGRNQLFAQQVTWILIVLPLFFVFSFIDWRFIKRTDFLVALFICVCLLLLGLFVLKSVRGARSWIDFGFISFQPADFARLVLVAILAKYFSRRHIEIANLRHILVSGFYALIFFALVLLQPDFGSAVIIFMVWLGMVLVSGISKRHLLAVFLVCLVIFAGLWFFVFKDYQKERVITFAHPLADIRGSGYNAYQSTIAVGSGGFLGKGIGYGTQSRLKFLPEHETDFIFAAFAEEWGFLGVLILFLFYGIFISRILSNALRGATNFETLFGIGLAILFMSQFVINIGMNIGLLPVTGIALPFMSYGGTNLFTSFIGLGILMGMRRYQRMVRGEVVKNEIDTAGD